MDGRYSKHFSEKSLWEKIKTYSKDAGVKVVYVALLLFYVMKDDAVAIKSKLTIAAALGYFILPESSWMENYYNPLKERLQDFLKRHHHSDLAQKIVNETLREIDLYVKYKEYYSYGFYIAQRN